MNEFLPLSCWTDHAGRLTSVKRIQANSGAGRAVSNDAKTSDTGLFAEVHLARATALSKAMSGDRPSFGFLFDEWLALAKLIWELRRTKTEVVLSFVREQTNQVQVLTAGLLAHGGDAPDGVSDIIGNQKRSGLVEGESDRPSARLARPRQENR